MISMLWLVLLTKKQLFIWCLNLVDIINYSNANIIRNFIHSGSYFGVILHFQFSYT